MSDATRHKFLKKGEYLVRAGEVLDEVCFLEKGILRGYFIDVNGKEMTDCLCCQCGFPALTFCGLETNVPSPMTVQMLKDGSFFCIPISVVVELQNVYPEILQFYNRLLVMNMSVHWKLKQILYQYTALQRYQWFLQEYPGLIDEVKNKYVASFLGMTSVTLSRLRRFLREEEEI